ncbi:MAG: zeta toxin family protein [Verrucomicrobiota bacterium]
MLAGPNGAGKSTFYQRFLSDKKLPFINADIIARDFDIDPYKAAKIAAEMRENLMQRKTGFITETVLSDPVGEKVGILKHAAESGYAVSLFFIGLENPQLSARRVKARVEAGGHDVPEEKLMARYDRTLKNLQLAIEQLPHVVIYDNSRSKEPYRFLAEFREGKIYSRGEHQLPKWVEPFL